MVRTVRTAASRVPGSYQQRTLLNFPRSMAKMVSDVAYLPDRATPSGDPDRGRHGVFRPQEVVPDGVAEVAADRESRGAAQDT